MPLRCEVRAGVPVFPLGCGASMEYPGERGGAGAPSPGSGLPLKGLGSSGPERMLVRAEPRREDEEEDRWSQA